MKRKITILLATGIIVTLVAFSLVFVKAASSHRAEMLRASSDNYAAVRASAGKHSDSDQVGASVPPEYHYDPINERRTRRELDKRVAVERPLELPSLFPLVRSPIW